ncbi:MAG: sigma-70 family RNA polymerase sigma factor, partial [Candidatus Hydrogenedentales bacterium]
MFGFGAPHDETVIASVLEGRQEKFGVLVQRYLPVVQAIAYARLGNRTDVDDVAQEAFLRAYRNLDQLRERQKFAAWLAVITRNVIVHMQQKRGKEDEAAKTSHQDGLVEAPDFARLELRKAVRDQIDLLEPEAREVLLLKYFADKSSQEIAGILEQSDAAIRKRLQRAREALGERLLAEFKEDDTLAARRQSQSRKILGTVLATGAAWSTANTAAAATGAGASSGFLGLGGVVGSKLTLSLAAIVLLCGTAALFSQVDLPLPSFTSAGPAAVPSTATSVPAAHPSETPVLAVNNRRPAVPEKPSGISVSGRILQTDGRPVAGATVYGAYHGRNPRLPRATAESDANGAYTLYLSEPWADFRVWGVKDGFVAFNHAPFDATANGVTGADCTLFREARIQGYTVAKNGSLLPNMPIAGYNHNDTAYQQLYQSKSNEHAEFALTKLPPGTYSLGVTSDIAFDATRKALQVEVKEGDYLKDIRVTYEGDGFVISGRVTTDDGAPLPGVTVGIGRQVGSPEPPFETPLVKTDENGYYRLTQVPRGMRSLQLRKEHYSDQGLGRDVESGTEDADFVMHRLATVSGRVIDAATKQPLGSAEVLVASSHVTTLDSRHGDFFKPVNDDQGHFEITDACLGKATVIAKADTYMPTLQQVELAPGQHLEGITLEMSPGLTLDGVVVDTTGAPIPGAAILLGEVPCQYTVSPGSKAEKVAKDAVAKSAQDGSFSVTDLSPGPHVFGVYCAGYAAGSARVVVSSGSPQPPVRVVLAKGGVLRGVVRLGGSPHEGVFVLAVAAAGGASASDEVVTAADGTFELTNVQPGEVEVRAKLVVWPTDFGGRSLSQAATVSDGHVTAVDIDFPAEVGRLEGSVGVTGEPKLDGIVYGTVPVPGGREEHFSLLNDGQFRFEQVPSGILRGEVRVDLKVDGELGYECHPKFEAIIQPNETASVAIRLSGESGIAGHVSGIQPTERGYVMILADNVAVTASDIKAIHD